MSRAPIRRRRNRYRPSSTSNSNCSLNIKPGSKKGSVTAQPKIIRNNAACLPAPHTKLAATRRWHTTTLAQEFGVSAAGEDDVYAALDRLLER
jgi:hypothetical protein